MATELRKSLYGSDKVYVVCQVRPMEEARHIRLQLSHEGGYQEFDLSLEGHQFDVFLSRLNTTLQEALNKNPVPDPSVSSSSPATIDSRLSKLEMSVNELREQVDELNDNEDLQALKDALIGACKD